MTHNSKTFPLGKVKCRIFNLQNYLYFYFTYEETGTNLVITALLLLNWQVTVVMLVAGATGLQNLPSQPASGDQHDPELGNKSFWNQQYIG